MHTIRQKEIKRVYQKRLVQDRIERTWRRLREKLLGVDTSIFDMTFLYYESQLGQKFSNQDAFNRALDKKRHKDTWYSASRETTEEMMQFYQEVDVYPFRQPYLKRFGGYRWYAALVDHIQRPSILEYSCGSVVLTEYLVKHAPHCRYTVADIPSTTLNFEGVLLVVTPKDWTHPLIQGIVQDGGGYNGKTTQLRRRVQG